MTKTRVILDPAGPGNSTFSDPGETLKRTEFAARVAAVAAALADHAPMRICLPLLSDLGSLAALVAALESHHSVALIPGGDAPEVPAFASAVLTGAPGGGFALQMTGTPAVADATDRIYLRSSGSTGTPKWAVHGTDRLLFGNGAAVIERLALRADDKVMLPVPIHHMYGLGAGLIPAMTLGASIHLVPRGNPLTVFAAQRAVQPDVMFLVPSQCRSIMALGRVAGQLRLVVVAGDKLGADEAAAFEEKHGLLVNLYGSTELGAITAGRPSDPPALRHPFAGPVLSDFELAVMPTDDPDAAAGAQVMRIRSEHGLFGYADPATGEIDRPAGEYWTTGDLVRAHDGGLIEVLGRSDFAVNRDGLLVHMGDIETVISRVPGVAQAAVVSAGMTRRGAGLTAFCAIEDGHDTDDEAVMAACRAALQPRAVPDRLVVMAALPLLPSGKFDRRVLTTEAQSRLDA